MTPRSFGKWVLLVTPILISIAAFIFVVRQEKMYSDPSRFRGDQHDMQWSWWFRPRPARPFTQRLAPGEFILSETKDKLVLKITEKKFLYDQWHGEVPIQIEPDPGTFRVDTEDGVEIRLAHVVTSFQIHKDQTVHKVFKLPDLIRLPPTEERRWLEGRTIPGGSNGFPNVTLHLIGKQLSQLEGVNWIYNQDTQDLISSYLNFNPSDPSEQLIHFSVEQWHPSPVLISLRLDSSRFFRHNLPPQVGAEISHAHFDLGIFFIKEVKGVADGFNKDGYTYDFKSGRLKEPQAIWSLSKFSQSADIGTAIGFEFFNCIRQAGNCVINYHLTDGRVIEKSNWHPNRLQWVVAESCGKLPIKPSSFYRFSHFMGMTRFVVESQAISQKRGNEDCAFPQRLAMTCVSVPLNFRKKSVEAHFTKVN